MNLQAFFFEYIITNSSQPFVAVLIASTRNASEHPTPDARRTCDQAHLKYSKYEASFSESWFKVLVPHAIGTALIT